MGGHLGISQGWEWAMNRDGRMEWRRVNKCKGHGSFSQNTQYGIGKNNNNREKHNSYGN